MIGTAQIHSHHIFFNYYLFIITASYGCLALAVHPVITFYNRYYKLRILRIFE